MLKSEGRGEMVGMTERKILEQRFAPVVAAIRRLQEEKEDIIVAVDGRCGSGKSTLGAYLAEQFECNLFHMDDFFLRPWQRTEERAKEPGGNVDYERFAKEVLEPLREKEPVGYQRYDCAIQQLMPVVWLPYRRINVIEGSYSMHPYFKEPYSLKVFLTIEREKQLDIIRERSGEEKLKRFIEEWIPKEEAYFKAYEIKKGCMLLEWQESMQ